MSVFSAAELSGAGEKSRAPAIIRSVTIVSGYRGNRYQI